MRPTPPDRLGTLIVAVPLLLAGCARGAVAPGTGSPFHAATPPRGLPDIALVADRVELITVGGVGVYNGGFGSAIVPDPAATGRFYLLTDRGPNYDLGEEKAFPVPAYAPQIGRFQLVGSELRLVERIPIRRADGTELSGLPNTPAGDGADETPVAPDGKPLAFDDDGLDSEGLAVAGDGTFWVADEYGPHLVHLDGQGRTLERINPYTRGRALPAVFATRRPNRGMEGLTMLPDGETLVGAMQSALDNPKSAGRSSRITRLLRFDTRTGETRQYVYLLEESDLLTSEIAAVTEDVLLTLERDGDFPGDGSTVKRIYKVDLRGATDVSDPSNAPTGQLFDGRTLEQLPVEELERYGIVPVRKVLVADLLALGYPHDKPEGLAVLDDFTILVSNDDDFGVTDGEGGLVAKTLPALNGAVDHNTVWFIRVTTPLRDF